MSEIENKKPESEEEGRKVGLPFELSDLWKGLRKFWWIAVVLGVTFCGLLFLKSYAAFRPQYTVSATFTVNTQNLSLTGEGVPSYSYYYDNATASQLADTFPYILSSNLLTEAICNDMDLPYLPVTLSATSVTSTNMFTMKAVGSDAQMTYDVLLSAMKNYPSVARYLVGNVMLTMISVPTLPTEPSNKFTYTTAIKGFMLGIAIGAAWIFVYALMRKTIKTKTDIKTKLKLQVLGTLPEVTFKKYKTQEIDYSILIHNEKVGKGFLEAVRIFRNSFLHFLGEDQKVIMSTSTAPSEGKTTVIVNLAISLADTGKKVLLVDGDLRNPSVAPALNMNPEEIEFDRNEQFYSVKYLDEYGFTYLKPNTADNNYWKIMNRDKLKSIFDEFRDDFDLILVDTPPCGLVADTLVIASACDAAMYVILQDTVREKRVLEGINGLLHTDIPVLGAVLNGAQSGLAGYGDNYGYGYSNYGHYKNYSKYGYGYGYGYGYEYGSKKSKKKKSEKDSVKESDTEPKA